MSLPNFSKYFLFLSLFSFLSDLLLTSFVCSPHVLFRLMWCVNLVYPFFSDHLLNNAALFLPLHIFLSFRLPVSSCLRMWFLKKLNVFALCCVSSDYFLYISCVLNSLCLSLSLMTFWIPLVFSVTCPVHSHSTFSVPFVFSPHCVLLFLRSQASSFCGIWLAFCGPATHHSLPGLVASHWSCLCVSTTCGWQPTLTVY